MPEITRDTEFRSISLSRFVRVGDKIYVSDDVFANHSTVAVEYGVKEMWEDDPRLPVVDDAGVIKITRDNKIIFDETTMSTHVRDNKAVARKRTIEIGIRIFGREKVSDEYSIY